MTRYTISGETNDRARVARRRGRLTFDEAWAITLTADRLHGIGASLHPRPVHRERVRFGAWEERPTAATWATLDLTPHIEAWREAVEKISRAYTESRPVLASALATLARDAAPAPLWADSPDLAEDAE